MPELTGPELKTRGRLAWRVALFLAILLVGEWFVKWDPYYHKAFVAAVKHSIGRSAISGGAAAPPAVGIPAAWHYAARYFKAVWQAVILGVVVGAAVQVLIPTSWILKILGRPRTSSVLTAGALAVPGMMCTCCSAPIVVGLRRQNVAPGAALAFWLANPVLNPATIVFIGFVLGWNFALVRLIFGLILVFGAGLLVNRFSPGAATPETVRAAVENVSVPEGRPLWLRFLIQMGRMSISVVPVYILLVLAVGALRGWLFPAVDFGHADGLLWVLGMAVAGTVFVIPTAGEVPVIQTMMHYGLGLGPAWALLITLPAVSAPSMAMVWRQFPQRVLMFTAAATLAAGLAAGVTGLL